MLSSSFQKQANCLVQDANEKIQISICIVRAICQNTLGDYSDGLKIPFNWVYCWLIQG